jgi:hypothetical protein
MTMDPKDRKPATNPGNDWEQDLESARSILSTMEFVEPPDLLDQAVLNTARRELAAARRKSMHWVGAFATAAVVILALTIVLQQDQKIPEPYRGNGIKLDAARPAAPEKKSAAGTSAMSVPVDEPVPAQSRMKPEDEDFESQSAPSPDTAQQTGVLREEPVRDELRRIDPPAPKTAQELSEKVVPDPAAWIERILELQRAERYEELKHELEAFRQAYPEYPLPPQLQD